MINKLQQGNVIPDRYKAKPNTFIDSWNKTRLGTGNFNDQLGNGNIDTQKANRDSAYVFTNPTRYGYYSFLKSNPVIRNKSTNQSLEDATLERNKIASGYAATTKRRLDSNLTEDSVIGGEYTKGAHTIFYNEDMGDPSILTHEQAHSSKAAPQESKIQEIMGTSDKSTYKFRPTEIYSRLMQFREVNKIDPNKIWTEKEVKGLRKSATDYDLLHLFKPKETTRLLNEVAQTKPNSTNTLFAQEGAVLQQDNTRVDKPTMPQRIKAKQPQSRQSSFTQDNRSNYERIQSQDKVREREQSKTLNSNQHLWNMNPTRRITAQNAGAEFQNNKDALKATMVAGTGVLAATAPIATASAITGNWATNKIVQNHSDKNSWGELMQDKTGVGNSKAWELTNPGGLLGGMYGIEKQVLLGGKNILSKFIKGDTDLGWNALNKNHWIFNSANPMNVTLATANRVAPFLNPIEKIPGKIATYQVAKRTNGNASISIKDVLANEATYKGTVPGASGKNVLGFYMFNDTPFINKSKWFKTISKEFKLIDGNERARGFSHGERYDNLYPGLNERRYYMSSVVKHNYPLNLTGDEATNYIGGNIGKVVGKESAMVMPRGDGKWIKFRNDPGENWVFPLDDIAGHVTKLHYNKGQLNQTSQDLWKFNPGDYSKRWGDTPTGTEAVRLTKQAALMDKLGRPFILQQSNPININRKRVLATSMRQGGRFTFKKNALIKSAEELNGKRDMRKKFIKSNTKHSDYKIRRIRKGASGIKFVSYEDSQPTSIRDIDFSSAFQTDYKFPTQPSKEPIQQPMKEQNPTQPVIQQDSTPTPKAVSDPKFTGNKDFIRQMRPAFITSLTKRGLDPKYADYLVAQSALESGWGKHQSGKFNFGGIKGKGTVRKTREVINGKNVMINDSFRDFDSIEDYADYHVNLLNNKRYNAFNSNDFIGSVVKGGYATDPSYKSVLSKMYQQITNA